MTSHYLNQWWLIYWRIYASLCLNELNKKSAYEFVKYDILPVYEFSLSGKGNLTTHRRLGLYNILRKPPHFHWLHHPISVPVYIHLRRAVPSEWRQLSGKSCLQAPAARQPHQSGTDDMRDGNTRDHLQSVMLAGLLTNQKVIENHCYLPITDMINAYKYYIITNHDRPDRVWNSLMWSCFVWFWHTGTTFNIQHP